MRKKIWSLIFVLFALVAMGSHACAAKGDTLNAEEAKSILSELIPNVKIIHAKQSAVAGLWEIGIDAGGKKSIVYLDHAKKYVIAGNLIDIKTKANLTQESFQKINKVDVSQIPLKDAVVLGDKTAKHKVIVFSDPD
jgi:thiol:disulfide interchange protein DsbC